MLLPRTFRPAFSSRITKKKLPQNHMLQSTANFTYPNENNENQTNLPTQSHVVIAGAGITANSVAYHLTKLGLRDVIVLEQNKIASGTSDFDANIISMFKPIIMRNIIRYSIELYKELNLLGFDTGFKQSGCIHLAQTRDRIIALKRRMAYNTPNGQHCEYLTPEDVKRKHPYLRVGDIEGGVWVAEDGVASPKAICRSLSVLAKQKGVQYFEGCLIKEVCTKNGRVYGVKTDKGFVNCEIFVNCTGMWARELGLRCNPQVRIPTYPAEHFCASTDQVVDDNLPSVKDYDGHTYLIEFNRSLRVGWFEKEAKPAFGNVRIPKDWKKHLQDDFEHLKPLWQKAVHRIPFLKEASNTHVTNTADNFTPDGRWILGEAPEVKNYFVAGGMNGNSLQGSGGIGKTVAEWIIEGRPTTDLIPFNIARFLDLHNNRQYLYQRTKEVVGRHYSILYPHQCEYKYARKLRCSPLYSVLEKRGAVFGIKMGYERALYFDTSSSHDNSPRKMPPGSFFKPKFFDFMRKEYHACRYRVGIIDMSSFSKIKITSKGEEAITYLQNLCSNDVDIPIGGLVHTGMQNEKGGYENDCMLVRLESNSYFMVSPTSQQTRIYDWMSRNLPDSSILLKDVTSMYTVINVVGPKSHNLLSKLSGTAVNILPFTYKSLDIGYVSDIMVMGFTHTGEPGYCLYVPSEYALHVYNNLMTAGKEYGVRDVGTLTQRFMRIERFIPFWAEELSSEVTPFESGNGYRVKLEKGNFIGRNALILQKEKGVKKKIVMFHLKNFDSNSEIWPWGGEPIYRNGEYVGAVTSSGYGFTTKSIVCLGFIRKPKGTDPIVSDNFIMDTNAHYELDIAGNRFQIVPHIHPPYFPTKP